ncbi:unnamed protein product [Amoebophrya sp. A25]|nr:unnamed protein product [Amoebophrya sp. A25]|eukprot:GSA25T00006337001.1
MIPTSSQPLSGGAHPLIATQDLEGGFFGGKVPSPTSAFSGRDDKKRGAGALVVIDNPVTGRVVVKRQTLLGMAMLCSLALFGLVFFKFCWPGRGGADVKVAGGVKKEGNNDPFGQAAFDDDFDLFAPKKKQTSPTRKKPTSIKPQVVPERPLSNALQKALNQTNRAVSSREKLARELTSYHHSAEASKDSKANITAHLDALMKQASEGGPNKTQPVMNQAALAGLKLMSRMTDRLERSHKLVDLFHGHSLWIVAGGSSTYSFVSQQLLLQTLAGRKIGPPMATDGPEVEALGLTLPGEMDKEFHSLSHLGKRTKSVFWKTLSAGDAMLSARVKTQLVWDETKMGPAAFQDPDLRARQEKAAGVQPLWDSKTPVELFVALQPFVAAGHLSNTLDSPPAPEAENFNDGVTDASASDSATDTAGAAAATATYPRAKKPAPPSNPNPALMHSDWKHVRRGTAISAVEQDNFDIFRTQFFSRILWMYELSSLLAGIVQGTRENMRIFAARNQTFTDSRDIKVTFVFFPHQEFGFAPAKNAKKETMTHMDEQPYQQQMSSVAHQPAPRHLFVRIPLLWCVQNLDRCNRGLHAWTKRAFLHLKHPMPGERISSIFPQEESFFSLAFSGNEDDAEESPTENGASGGGASDETTSDTPLGNFGMARIRDTEDLRDGADESFFSIPDILRMVREHKMPIGTLHPRASNEAKRDMIHELHTLANPEDL